MIEIIIERWSGPDGTAFRWSLWLDGSRVEMGGPHAAADDSEAEARAHCARLGRTPDRVTRL
jgi:hypothetical protein